MYSSNHSVRYCSTLNLHIIITQMVLPNQSKHMDMILRELWGYYAGPLAHTFTQPRTHKHAHTPTFPRLNKCQIRSPQQEITSRSWGRSFLRACDPLHIPPAAAGSCISTAQAHTHSHLSVIQQYASSTIWGSRAASYCVKIARCKRICKRRQWWPERLFQEICETICRCEECIVQCVVFVHKLTMCL